MECVEGQPLKGPLPVPHALKYAGQICEALDAAHKKGITHRDLKPGNILVNKLGVKLLDFGLARIDAPDSTVTMAVMGTPPTCHRSSGRANPLTRARISTRWAACCMRC
jgi:serine/threonine protein kinase